MTPASIHSLPPRRRSALPLVASAALAWPLLAGGVTEAAPEFAEADIFFEFNSTDRDLGAQVSLDGEDWKELRIEGPGGRKLLQVKGQGPLMKLGLTELFFEGAEPPLEEIPFAKLLTLVPPGQYLFTGRTIDNRPLRSTDPLTTDLPCPPRIISPEEDEAVPLDKAVVRWKTVPGVYDPDRRRCKSGEEVELVGFQIIVEVVNEKRELLRSYSVDLPPDATFVPIPPQFLKEGVGLKGTEFLLEVLAIEDTGNKTITTATFKVERPRAP